MEGNSVIVSGMRCFLFNRVSLRSEKPAFPFNYPFLFILVWGWGGTLEAQG